MGKGAKRDGSRRVLVDTTILIDHLRKKAKRDSIFDKLLQRHDILISVMTVYEMEFGAAIVGRMSDLKEILLLIEVIPISQEIAEVAARLHADLVKSGQEIGIKDIFISATGLAHKLPVATLNVRHFERVPGLFIIRPDNL